MRTFIRSSSDDRPTEDAGRERRIELARRNSRWTEIDDDLVERGRLLVSASTDQVFKRYRGDAFETGSATLIAEEFPMFWYVDRGGDLVLLERLPGAWSEIVAKRAKRQART